MAGVLLLAMSMRALVAGVLLASACALPVAEEPAASAIGEGICAEAGGSLPSGPDCHPRQRSSVVGAYFRKVTSTADPHHGGIVVAGLLPLVSLDPDRWFSTSDPDRLYQNGPMDRPSVYLGGHAGSAEVDAGLTWDRVYHSDGSPTWTDDLSGCDHGDLAHRFVVAADGSVWSALGVPRLEGAIGLVPGFAFRAFWRARKWQNPDPRGGANHYFYPGEPIRMAVHVVGKDTLALYIHPDPTDGREIAVRFTVPGFGRGAPQSFKRVSSIDQFGLSNGRRVGLETLHSQVLPTRSAAVGAVWNEVTLLGTDLSPRCSLACGAPAVMGADAVFDGAGYDRIFRIAGQTAAGGETLDIVPSP